MEDELTVSGRWRRFVSGHRYPFSSQVKIIWIPWKGFLNVFCIFCRPNHEAHKYINTYDGSTETTALDQNMQAHSYFYGLLSKIIQQNQRKFFENIDFHVTLEFGRAKVRYFQWKNLVEIVNSLILSRNLVFHWITLKLKWAEISFGASSLFTMCNDLHLHLVLLYVLQVHIVFCFSPSVWHSLPSWLTSNRGAKRFSQSCCQFYNYMLQYFMNRMHCECVAKSVCILAVMWCVSACAFRKCHFQVRCSIAFCIWSKIKSVIIPNRLFLWHIPMRIYSGWMDSNRL